MDLRQGFRMKIGAGTVLLAAGAFLLAVIQAGNVSLAAVGTAPQSERIIRYIREKFGVPSSQNLSLGPLEAAPHAGYYRTLVTIEDGKEKSVSHRADVFQKIKDWVNSH